MSNYGGGGFGGGFNSPSAETPGSAARPQRKSYDEQTLVPMTIRQVITAPAADGGNGQILHNGREVHHVKIVAAIRSIDEQSTNITYEVEDGTGLIEVRKWISDSAGVSSDPEAAAVREHTYARLIGQVKDYEGKRSIVAYSVRKLSSGNELTHHFLEVVHTKFKEPVHGGADGTKLNMDGMMGNNNVYNNISSVGGQRPGIPINSNGGMDVDGKTGDPLQDAVLEYIKAEGDNCEVGADISSCIRHLGAQYSESDVRSAVNFLSEEGSIYSTIDESKYKYAL
uniref:Replication protein A C-terminal domain-containing protein n=1 Tax=Corethron hystrix TaxID=216773 RepID=A0A7S1BER7_9STRA|mmetsp:Transcript_23315/g.53238  ORF Transcript_23315/g.53238 Transcript_23315/m.53238 type:complete len:283 (+) Transcript_23315:129-977(+)|eukprot:CAMPEP_0113308904 /NCGR_PEP_ID=MMETSP0010_2-20120614/7168_1 /TAXON_ID=216773 ORGANISM="Corethron hystrix, Strain 308" /NCGR_SAMPLE_ID=MMETSP0010_2 /ASSEMBLY_ACC=CAM_ASM_000155 /LENGTH=282 /DNA_ID=CAMNT_0000164063 /DNA_START=72 /DNA_END=920 /DNA_ORIENTATION=+ /assembly_acc=CAM_ASM_000155